jgi:lysophospholipase L1-like esterase
MDGRKRPAVIFAAMAVLVMAAGMLARTDPLAIFLPARPPQFIVFDGDSLTAGMGAGPEGPYPAQVLRLLPGIQAANLGVPGELIANMAATAATRVDQAYQNRGTRRAVVIWGGTNDLCKGSNAAQIYSSLVQYGQARRKAGWRVLALTMLPRSGCPPSMQFEAQRERLNERIRANWAVFADGLVDVAADAHIGGAGASLDQQYYGDGIHLTEQGYAIVAQAVARGIKSLK